MKVFLLILLAVIATALIYSYKKEPFLKMEPLEPGENTHYWSLEEFRRYSKLCNEEDNILEKYHKLLSIK